MQEQTSQEVEIGQIEGPVLEALVSFMYGKFHEIPVAMLVILLVADDAHHVTSLSCFLCYYHCNYSLKGVPRGGSLFCVQVDALRITCIEQMMANLNAGIILDYAILSMRRP